MAKKSSGFSRAIKRGGQFAVYAALRLFEGVLFTVPLDLCWRLGERVGWLGYYLLPKYRRLTLHNLTIAFGGEKDEREIKELARKHFSALGRNFLCGAKVALMPIEKLAERVSFEGEREFREEVKAGRGIVAAVLHMGTWELSAQLPGCAQYSKKRSSLYQRLTNPFVDAHVRKMRAKSGLVLFDRKAGFYKPLEFLREGGVVAALVDQHAGDGGVWCPLFNRLASTSTLAGLLASRTGSKLIGLGILPDGVGRWKVVYNKALDPADFENQGGTGAMTAELNLAQEKLIRRAPEEWFWVHNRWKTPKPKFLLTGYKRGVQFPKGFDADKDLQPFRIVVRSPNWLGDACLAAPAVRAIKKGRPDVELTVLAPENLEGLWKRIEEVDAVITKGGNDSPWKVARSIKAAGRFDVGVVLPNSLRTAAEMWLAGLPRIVGFRGHTRSKLLNQVIPPPRGPVVPEHHSKHYLRLASGIGADVSGALAGGREMKKRGGRGGKTRVALCPGAVYGPAKRWHAERFAEVAKDVRDEAKVEWIIVGGASEAALGEELAGMIGRGCKNLVGKTTMSELIEELDSCALLLTNDTGTMHLADFLGVPTVALFGSTDPYLTGPMGREHTVVRHHVECSPCFLRKCPIDFRCMEEITADEVTQAVIDRLNRVR